MQAQCTHTITAADDCPHSQASRLHSLRAQTAYSRPKALQNGSLLRHSVNSLRCTLRSAAKQRRLATEPARSSVGTSPRTHTIRLKVFRSPKGRSESTLRHSTSVRAGPQQGLQAVSATVANLFPVWLVLGCLLALWDPRLFLWFRTDYVTAGLALTMLSMGTTLTLEDFTGVLKQGLVLPMGAALQYTIMPAMGFAVSRLAALPTPMAVGWAAVTLQTSEMSANVCLVASCPGGVASNVVTYLAGADVPLSVLMTTVSTLTAVVATPALVKLLVNSIVPVNAAALVSSTFQVVLLPVGLGAFLNQTFPSEMRKFSPFAPLLAVSMTVLICASIMAQNAAAVRAASLRLLVAVFSLHAGGFALGYGAARLFGVGVRQARTISIEVGMQNSTLGAVLAAVHFSDPLTAVPCAISACMHSLLGSALAALFRRSDAGGLEGAPDAAAPTAAPGALP